MTLIFQKNLVGVKTKYQHFVKKAFKSAEILKETVIASLCRL